MLWRGQRESGNIVDQRSMGAGSLGIGGLILGAIVYYFAGGNPLVYVAQNAGQVGTTSRMSQSAQVQDDSRKNFVGVVLADTEDVWTSQFRARGKTYQQPKLVLFRGATRTACGSANSAVGPFYCPGDERVYLDTSFFDDLSGELGAKGEAAQAYVIAHEIGHHVQHLLGIDGGRAGGNQGSVALELQADCLAGVWAAQIQKQKSVLEPGDVENALNAAAAVGDDRLQSRNGGQVVPDSFTHGSSAQRVSAFRRGYQGSQLEACL